jgi:hypothetical protein
MSCLNKLRVCLKFRLNWADFSLRLLRCCRKFFRGETKPRTTSREYYRSFEDCQTSIEDDPRSGRHAAATEDDSTETVWAFILSNRRLAVRELADECPVSVGGCHIILKESETCSVSQQTSLRIC